MNAHFRSVAIPPSCHPAIAQASALLMAFTPEARKPFPFPVDCLLHIASGPATPPYFAIEIVDERLVFKGDRPRSLFAGVSYFLHHAKRNTLPAFPLKRQGSTGNRLVIEDFPFHCYAPTGFDFDPEPYASNLAALGFTSMECNRLHPGSCAGKYYDAYQLTNPSPALFVWTPWHEGVWDKDEISRNAEELDRCIRLALKYDLDPSITSFVPRPYPEAFFLRHPHLRGPSFRHEYLKLGNHSAVSSLDTDHPETMRFYAAVYAELFDRYPQLGHLCFWHGDLGTQFWKDGEGPRRRSLASRIAEFHEMIARLLAERSMQTKVWMNPWALAKECLGQVNAALPGHVGFTVKDNPGAEIDTGSQHSHLGDATVITARIGTTPLLVKELADQKGRRICLGQYIDFSEDLDPVLGVPHPIMTFRKLAALRRFGASDSSGNWGILSPEITPVNPNQDVLREMGWGDPSENFVDLLLRILPGGLCPVKQDAVLRAWISVDDALRSWPQFWGMRLQDSGVRLRWLVRPLLPPGKSLNETEREYYLQHQIYRIDAPDISTAFMHLSEAQAFEVAQAYEKMTGNLRDAEGLLESAQSGESQEVMVWLASQVASLRLLRCFWTTYANHLKCFGAGALFRDSDLTCAQMRAVQDELENVDFTIEHLTSHPSTLLTVSRNEWGQCFGPNFIGLLRLKHSLMRRALGLQ